MSGTLPIFVVPKSVPERGDHIFTNRKIALYSHHGIYVGDDMVIHFGISSVPPCKNKNKKCDNKRVIKNDIAYTCLDCFLCGGQLFAFGYRQFNLDWRLLIVRFRNFSLAKSKPADEVVKTAFKLLNQKGGFGKYDLVTNNCEHFASYCKTGSCASLQLHHYDCLGKLLKGKLELPSLAHII